MSFAGFSKIIAPRAQRKSTPGAEKLCHGRGEFALSKTFPGGLPGGLLGLEFIDT